MIPQVNGYMTFSILTQAHYAYAVAHVFILF